MNATPTRDFHKPTKLSIKSFWTLSKELHGTDRRLETRTFHVTSKHSQIEG